MKFLDSFGTTVGFNLVEGEENHTSWQGALMSLGIMIVVFAYLVQSVIVLCNYQGTMFTSTLLKNYFSNEYIFGQDAGF